MCQTGASFVVFVGVFMFCVASVGASRFRYPSHDDEIDDDSDGPGGCNCDEIKLELQDLRQLLIGLRVKLDPDFKQTPCPESKCPPGFQYVKLDHSCYKIVYNQLTWTEAGQRCQALHPKAHLVAITTEAENIGLMVYLKKELAKNSRRIHLTFGGFRPRAQLWTSGQRLNETDCSDEFVWKVADDTHLPLSYTYWYGDEPNCQGRTPETCVEIRSSYEFKWNDMPCGLGLYPLCEYNPL